MCTKEHEELDITHRKIDNVVVEKRLQEMQFTDILAWRTIIKSLEFEHLTSNAGAPPPFTMASFLWYEFPCI